jgi:hypothetical protein
MKCSKSISYFRAEAIQHFETHLSMEVCYEYRGRMQGRMLAVHRKWQMDMPGEVTQMKLTGVQLTLLMLGRAAETGLACCVKGMPRGE